VEIKYTREGKKVAVLGKLNNEQWICQEIFVSNGQEFPAGENFVEKTLLDSPAVTWKQEEEKNLEKRKEKLAQEIKDYEAKSDITYNKSRVAGLINKVNNMYPDFDASQLETMFLFMTGQITHLVVKNYGEYEIRTLTDVLKDEDCDCNRVRLNGLKLLVLYGCSTDATRWEEKKPNFRLDWRISRYRDGSGGETTVTPCKSYEEAIAFIESSIEMLDTSDSLIKLKEKYNLANPIPEKIKKYYKKRAGEQALRITKMQTDIGKEMQVLTEYENKS